MFYIMTIGKHAIKHGARSVAFLGSFCLHGFISLAVVSRFIWQSNSSRRWARSLFTSASSLDSDAGWNAFK